MKTLFKYSLLSLALLAGAFTAQAQVKIGDSPTTINAGSVLELQSIDKGLLMPRINLTNTSTWGLAGTQVAGMHVYNTNVGIISTNVSYPVLVAKIGEYYWDGTGWVALAPAGVQNSPVLFSIFGVVDQTVPYMGTTLVADPINFTQTRYDKGNDFNLTSKKFVVPANGTGYYQINVTGGTAIRNYSQGIYISLFVNNNQVRVIINANGAPSAGIGMGGSIIHLLHAGEVVDFRTIATAPNVVINDCNVDLVLISR